jgi:hypothetical protein
LREVVCPVLEFKEEKRTFIKVEKKKWQKLRRKSGLFPKTISYGITGAAAKPAKASGTIRAATSALTVTISRKQVALYRGSIS